MPRSEVDNKVTCLSPKEGIALPWQSGFGLERNSWSPLDYAPYIMIYGLCLLRFKRNTLNSGCYMHDALLPKQRCAGAKSFSTIQDVNDRV
jgi:hypothetical protein